MAFPYTFQFRGGQGPDFNVEISTTADEGSPIIATAIASITWVELNNLEEPTGVTKSFVPGSDTLFPNAPAFVPAGNLYFNWRTGDTLRHPISNGTQPSTGEYSFDIWPDPNGGQSILPRDIGEFGLTWTGLVNTYNTISLDPNKHSVFYDYGAPCALGWKLGGTITIAVS